MTTSVFYTGVGNRKAPASALALCREVSLELASRGLSLRTGDATGCDAAFLDGNATARQDAAFAEQEPPLLAEVYSPGDDLPTWSFDLARSLVGPQEWLSRSEQVRRLFARNMLQVLGRDGRAPSRFLLCWTHYRDSRASSAGGTRLAVRCADQPEARAEAGVSNAPVPWMNLLGCTVADALAFAHEHAGVPVLRPGDVLPARLVPEGSLVWCDDSAGVFVDRAWFAVLPWGDLSAAMVPTCDARLRALGLSRETASNTHLRGLVAAHKARRTT